MARTARKKRRNPPAQSAPTPTPAPAVTVSPETRLLALIIGVALLLRIGILATTHFTSEDSLITLRYAENLAHGLGFVYNPGERVLGVTTPLYAFLLALFAKAGLPAIECGKLANILADGALCAVVYRWLRAVGYGSAALLAAFFVAVDPLHVRWSVSGMETSLVALFSAAACLAWTERRYLGAYLLLAILFLLRWDGALLAGVLTVALALRERRIPWRETLLYLILIAPWLLFATRYFGSPIPVTAMAKATVYGWHGANPIFPRSPGLLARMFGTPAAVLATTLALLGLWRVVRDGKTDLAPPLVWMALYGVALCVTPVLLFEWYLVPPLPVYEALAAVGLLYLAGKFSPRWPARLQHAAALAGAYALLIGAGWWSYTLCQRGQRVEERLRKPLGLWLRQAARPTDRIMLEPIGYIGYYSRRPILDVIGLVSPEVLPFWKASSPDPLVDIALHFQPEWCVLRPAEVDHMRRSPRGPEWERAYAYSSSFSFSGERAQPPYVFRVYKRR